jgi:hypothetical protein
MSNEYADLTVSTVNDVMKTVNNDKDKANEILKGFVEEERRDREKKVQRLSLAYICLTLF